MSDGNGTSRRAFLKRAGALSLGAISARGVYGTLDEMGVAGPERAEAANVRRLQEQYLIEKLEVVLDNGVAAIVPPVFNDVFTAKLASGRTWNRTTLAAARTRLEDALKRVEGNHPATAAGLTIVVAWGLPYFRNYLPEQLWRSKLPVDRALTAESATTQYAVLDAIRFPSDPEGVVLEDNHVSFKFRSDSQTILQQTERALFDDTTSRAYVGDLFELTSKRMGFLGRGFGTQSVAKKLALQAGLPGASSIPDNAQLMMGFTSTQHNALGPENLPSFETLPGLTDQWPAGYFAAGCAMHLSHLDLEIGAWYDSFDYGKRVARMFSPRTTAADGTVTLPNGPTNVSSAQEVKEDATLRGELGHNATLQQATRLKTDVTDNYGRVRPAGTAVPIREDFNTIDNPFAWSSKPGEVKPGPTPGMHFVAFVPASHRFHLARRAMDGLLPDGTNLRAAPYNITDAQNGINALMRATHRQNYLVPPRSRRSFPLVDLWK